MDEWIPVLVATAGGFIPAGKCAEQFWLWEGLSELCNKSIAQSKEENSTPGTEYQLRTLNFCLLWAEGWAVDRGGWSSLFLKLTWSLRPTRDSRQKDTPGSRREVVLALPMLWSPFPNGLPHFGLFLAVFDVRGKDGCKAQRCSDTDACIAPSTGETTEDVMGKDVKKPLVYLLLQGFSFTQTVLIMCF